MHRQYDGSSAATTLEFDLRSDEGEVALYSNLTGTITINVWSGAAWVAYTTLGTAKVLDTSTNHAIIQGPGRFQVIKAINKPMAMVVGTNTSMREISGF